MLTCPLLQLLIVNSVSWVLNGDDVDLEEGSDVVQKLVTEDDVLSVSVKVDQCLARTYGIRHVHAWDIVAYLLVVIIF